MQSDCSLPQYKTGQTKHFLNYTVVSKNIPPLTCYNLDVHDPITIIFGRSVTKKVRNQMMHCFPTSHVQCFCTTLQNRKPRNCVFSLKHCMLLCQQTHKTNSKTTIFVFPHFARQRRSTCYLRWHSKVFVDCLLCG